MGKRRHSEVAYAPKRGQLLGEPRTMDAERYKIFAARGSGFTDLRT